MLQVFGKSSSGNCLLEHQLRVADSIEVIHPIHQLSDASYEIQWDALEEFLQAVVDSQLSMAPQDGPLLLTESHFESLAAKQKVSIRFLHFLRVNYVCVSFQ